jgi:hypothetical protein
LVEIKIVPGIIKIIQDQISGVQPTENDDEVARQTSPAGENRRINVDFFCALFETFSENQ